MLFSPCLFGISVSHENGLDGIVDGLVYIIFTLRQIFFIQVSHQGVHRTESYKPASSFEGGDQAASPWQGSCKHWILSSAYYLGKCKRQNWIYQKSVQPKIFKFGFFRKDSE